MQTSAYRIAGRFLGLKETPGPRATPAVLAMLQLQAKWVTDDATAWCGAFAGVVAHLLELPTPASPLTARAWLTVGTPVDLVDAKPENDVVILKRGRGPQPGPEVTSGASGHVGFFGGLTADHTKVLVRGGNQGDAVSDAWFPASQVLGVRRLA